MKGIHSETASVTNDKSSFRLVAYKRKQPKIRWKFILQRRIFTENIHMEITACIILKSF